MSRCELSGKGPVVKNLVSHSNIKTKFLAQPNVQRKQVFSTALNRLVRFHIATSTLRDMEHVGGLDTYILNQADKSLSKRAITIKNKIRAQLKKKQKAVKAPKAAKGAKK
jgi:large subunit ribosomal protein L28